MKLNKTKKKKRLNQGNSFIVVVATVSFLAVLVTALLVAVALCFRMKAYDINSRDNFYYLERAMDEIYEGVGAKTMQHLSDAYNETIEVLVYFDPDKESYVTMKDEDANKLMKKNFINKLKNDTTLYPDKVAVENVLMSFITEPSGITLSLSQNPTMDNDTGVLTIRNLVLRREAEYSTVNTIKGSNQPSPATYIQSITTDLVIAPPSYDVDFTMVGNDVNDLYEYVMISDMGVEITGFATRSHITGNIYAAADFYNKEYNNDSSTSVNSYTADQLKNCDGISEKSMYSGFYVSGAKVSVIADKMVVPGSIATMNCGELSIVGSSNAGNANYSQVWADGIILGGYSRKMGSTSSSYTGSVVKMKADTYVYDDLEVNATGSKYTLDGTYFGYNYATTDNRVYSDEFIMASTNRKYLPDVKINDGNYLGDDGNGGHLVGQAHYNSSAVVVNGEDTVLDLSDATSMYIAGQAYVELSKNVESKDYQVAADMTLTETTSSTKEEDKVTVDRYSYEGKDDDNYTTDNAEDEDAKKRIQDYRTGEGLSVKSNQLAYIPPYNVQEDEDGNIYVEWPVLLTQTDYFKDIWKDLKKVPVIKTVVSGKINYFYDFSKAEADITMNEYLEEYAKLFDMTPEQNRSTGTLADFYDITDYELFKVDNVILDGNAGTANVNDIDNIKKKLYTNSAISVKKDGKIKVIADSKSMDVLTNAANALNNMNNVTNANAAQITLGLHDEYKEMKMLLTNDSTNSAGVTAARTTPESTITPINYYFDFTGLDHIDHQATLASGYKVYVSGSDVKVTGNNGLVKGIVISKGDVTFDSTVSEFEGLIVAGGKIIVNKSINFVANPEVVKSILREYYESESTRTLSERLNDPKNAEEYKKAFVCSIFKDFAREYDVSDREKESVNVKSMKSITAIQYEDMLSFNNWKKNVD